MLNALPAPNFSQHFLSCLPGDLAACQAFLCFSTFQTRTCVHFVTVSKWIKLTVLPVPPLLAPIIANISIWLGIFSKVLQYLSPTLQPAPYSDFSATFLLSTFVPPTCSFPIYLPFLMTPTHYLFLLPCSCPCVTIWASWTFPPCVYVLPVLIAAICSCLCVAIWASWTYTACVCVSASLAICSCPCVTIWASWTYTPSVCVYASLASSNLLLSFCDYLSFLNLHSLCLCFCQSS